MSMYLGNIQVSPIILEDNFVEDNDGGAWERPSDWPDLDSLELDSSFEGLYLTYENTSTTALHCAKFSISMSPTRSYNVAIGYINNNNFVSLSNQDYTSGSALIDFSSINRDYVVIQILPNGNNHFTSFSFTNMSKTESGTAYSGYSYNQLCLERRGNLPYLNYIDYNWCTRYMQKDRTSFANQTQLTSLYRIYSYGVNLYTIDMSEWDTSNWAITSLSQMFQNCYNLKFLNLSSWNTSNWTVTSLSSMFENCYTLKFLDLSSWDTSNWVVTNLSRMFYECKALKGLNINTWNTSNWAVTDLSRMFYDCRALKELIINNWNTSNWAVTDLSCMVMNCCTLKELNINSWNTSNWAVTNLGSMFSSCYNLKFLDLNNWNTSNWAVTSLSGTWSSCWSLQTLNINNWDVSNWAVTDLSSTWYNCWSLQKILAFNWHLDCTKLTSLYYTWSSCGLLEEIDLSNWTFSNSLTDVRQLCGYCTSLKKLNIASISAAGITNYGTSYSHYIGSNNYSLKELNMPSNWQGGLIFSDCYALPRGQIVNALNKLADNTGGTTIKIYINNEMRSRLTDADLAIATNKGYTLST